MACWVMVIPRRRPLGQTAGPAQTALAWPQKSEQLPVAAVDAGGPASALMRSVAGQVAMAPAAVASVRGAGAPAAAWAAELPEAGADGGSLCLAVREKLGCRR